ncbi:hypothetical protein WDZ92_16380, partial [Nostoc sp. NIES-2111]
MVGVQQIGNPAGQAQYGYERIIGLAYFPGFIGKQFEGEIVAAFELGVRVQPIPADPEEGYAHPFQLVVDVAEAANLSRTGAGEVLGVEEEHDGLSGQVFAQRDVSPGTGGQGKVWG